VQNDGEDDGDMPPAYDDATHVEEESSAVLPPRGRIYIIGKYWAAWAKRLRLGETKNLYIGTFDSKEDAKQAIAQYVRDDEVTVRRRADYQCPKCRKGECMRRTCQKPFR